MAATLVSVRLAEPLKARMRSLADQDEAFRDWPVDFGSSSYVVRYRFDGEQVTILAVRHQREAGF